MAHSSEPRIQAFIADGSIAKGKAVKVASGYTAGHVAIGAANTDRCIGINQSDDGSASGCTIEVALGGGGAKGLLGETVSAGEDLVSHTDGTLVKPNAEGDQIIARAVESGVSGDLVAVEVYFATAHASQ
jgi:hypothetical protein